MAGEDQRVLVTGGTGTLGRHVAAVLDERGLVPRIVSRRSRPPLAPPGREWAQADLEGGDLRAAVEGCGRVIHLASGKGSGETDVVATARLLDAAADVGIDHVVVISIIGCDRIPLPFYASKVRIEALVRSSTVPWSIVRVAQFDSFVERLVATPATLPIPAPIVADLRFQPVDEHEAAERLVDVALGPPLGDAPPMAGPEVLTLAEIAATWLAETGHAARLIPVPLDVLLAGSIGGPAPAAWVRGVLEGYRAGENTVHGEATIGRVRFVDWVRARQPREDR
jgi:uncharacterized protein YbjT (DUF2867 family)